MCKSMNWSVEIHEGDAVFVHVWIPIELAAKVKEHAKQTGREFNDVALDFIGWSTTGSAGEDDGES